MISIQTIKFLGFWAVNAFLIWITASLAPKGLDLGNQHISPILSCIFAGYILSTVDILIEPTLALFKAKVKAPEKFTLISILVNTVAFWAVSRLALMVGVGVSAFWWAAVVGVILALGQISISQGLLALTRRFNMV